MRFHRTKMVSLAVVAMSGVRPFRVCETALLLSDPSLLICPTHRHGT
jgi:hypothetical protein